MSRRARAGLFIEMDGYYSGWVTIAGGLQDRLMVVNDHEFITAENKGLKFSQRETIGIIEEYIIDSPISCGEPIIYKLIQAITPKGNRLLAFNIETFNEIISRNED